MLFSPVLWNYHPSYGKLNTTITYFTETLTMLILFFVLKISDDPHKFYILFLLGFVSIDTVAQDVVVLVKFKVDGGSFADSKVTLTEKGQVKKTSLEAFSVKE